jgi:hypothetical protein
MPERRISLEQTALRGSLEVFDLTHPAGQWVPSRENLGHHLQVIDSKRQKSPTHSVDRTGLTLSCYCCGPSVVQRSPEPVTRADRLAGSWSDSCKACAVTPLESSSSPDARATDVDRHRDTYSGGRRSRAFVVSVKLKGTRAGL